MGFDLKCLRGGFLIRAQAREGKASGRKKPRSAGEAVASGEIQRRPSHATEGASPWSEAASVSRYGSAAERSEVLRDRSRAKREEPSTGGEGRAERQGRSPSSEALKGATPRASLVERHQGGRRRSKASRHMVSVKTQRDPDEANPGEVAFVGWVTLKGGETSGE
jgi:hypothetical protein